MMKQHDCDTVREMVFNYRRGELSELDSALFEETLQECEECSRYVHRVLDVLDVTLHAQAQDYLDRPIDDDFADALFASISQQLLEGEPELDDLPEDGEDEPVRMPVRLEFATSFEQDMAQEDEDDLSVPGHRPLWLGLAALLLVGVGAGAMAMFALEPVEPERAPVAVSASSDVALSRAFEQLQPQAPTTRAVKVFANHSARWTLEGKSPEYVLRLEQGTVLVEFLPRQKQDHLKVISGQTEVAVLGTVFYVSAEEPAQDRPARVGVLTGKVRVKQPQSPGQPAREVTLEDGEETTPTLQKTSMQQGIRAQSLVDLGAHRTALARRDAPTKIAAVAPKAPVEEPAAQGAQQPEPPAHPQPTTTSRGPSQEDLRARAQKSLRDRDYARAAKSYERLLDRLPPDHGERASVRLELARLYMRYLGKRDLAILHLRKFVQQHPLDVAAPSARRQLCQLLGMRAAQDPVCVSLHMK